MSDTNGNRRGPDGYLCCKHCAEDGVHDVDTDAHEGPCQTCDDPGALLLEQLTDAETKIARLEAALANHPRMPHELMPDGFLERNPGAGVWSE